MQAAVEIAAGSGGIVGGGILDLTGVGSAAAGVPLQAASAQAIAHGAATGANTLHNIKNDPILSKNAGETSGTGDKRKLIGRVLKVKI